MSFTRVAASVIWNHDANAALFAVGLVDEDWASLSSSDAATTRRDTICCVSTVLLIFSELPLPRLPLVSAPNLLLLSSIYKLAPGEFEPCGYALMAREARLPTGRQWPICLFN